MILIRFATWTLDHLLPQPYREALAGDLLEELRCGRSVAWYCRQVVLALSTAVFYHLRRLAPSLAFSVIWSLFYPLWRALLWQRPRTQAIFDQGSKLDWPVSAICELSRGILPALTFVWFGFTLCSLLRNQRTSTRLFLIRFLSGLSVSLSVLLVSTIALLGCMGNPASPHSSLSQSSPYLAPYHLVLSLPLALSLAAALVALLSPASTSSFAVSVARKP